MLLKWIKSDPPLHVSLNNSVTRQYLKNLRGVFFASQIFEIWSSNRIIEGNVQGGSDFIYFSSIMYLVTLNVFVAYH